jgi:hypothetical protein
MRETFLCAAALAFLGTVGCGSATTSYVKSETTLGRVVVYRNGVAYFERYAEVTGDSLKLDVPEDKVDDFLKSLTVVDAQTGAPAPITYPSSPARGGAHGTIDMKIGVTPNPPGKGPRKLRLSYVTEAPSWKPSYRVIVDGAGKVDIQGWAIVDNTSGEDWKNVKLGVGSSSAMSFRYDLKGLRLVERETLHQNDLFAIAPPTGGASYGGGAATPSGRRVLADVPDAVLANEEPDASRRERLGTKRPAPAHAAGATGGAPPAPPAADPIAQMARMLNTTPNAIVVEGYASKDDEDKMAASLERANRLRDQLVRNGVAADRIVAVGKGQGQGRSGGARVVEDANGPAAGAGKKKIAEGQTPADAVRGGTLAQAEAPSDAKAGSAGSGARATSAEAAAPGEPIGTSHFESATAMTVPRGTSAMVSILRAKTDGEVVYLYDPESARGNAQYPFRTVRFENPTDSALESGPVSVFGDGRFIGEGLAEPIPARSVAFVPFALDRQIVVEKKGDERDEIARILTVQRGVFSTEIKHTRRARFTLYNRLPDPAVVYIRHTVAKGYALTKAPGSDDGAARDGEGRGAKAGPLDGRDEHLGGARLFRIEVPAKGKTEVAIEEATPVYRSTDIRTEDGMDLVRAYVSSAALDGALKAQVQKLLDLNAEMAKLGEQIATAHEEMAEYRQRMDELHAQIFTLKAVKTAGPLMTHLEKKLQEISEKLSQATVDVVALQEKQMVARVSFQTGVGDLTLERGAEPKGGAKDGAKAKSAW